MNKYKWSYDDMGTPIDIKDIEYICRECAKERGGVWPENHISTWHTHTCENCGEKKSVCHKRNWDNLRD
jgi:hypothetical protein